MNKKNVAFESSVLQEMVKVKKIRFKCTEDEKFCKPSRDAIQRRANFEEFKVVYGDTLAKKSVTTCENGLYELHKTKSGSLCRFPKIKNEPQYVETINLELPKHFGADRAVQLLENKIKPKKDSRKVHREVTTGNSIEKLRKIEEVDETEEEESLKDITKKQIDEIQKQVKGRRVIWKNLPSVAVQKPKKKHTKDKIWSALSNINEKLEKMQKKYLNQPRIQYKSVNDCFTQSGNVEIIYENEKYPEEVKVSSEVNTCNIRQLSDVAIGDPREEIRIKEMNEMFPEFPKIEDTLREIEAHLDNIVNLEVTSGSIRKDSSTMSDGQYEDFLTKNNYWENGNLAHILGNVEQPFSPADQTNRILRELDQARDEKLKTIRHQIEEVEEFCDRMSEIANDSDDSGSVSTATPYAESRVSEKEELKSHDNKFVENRDKENQRTHLKDAEIIDFIEGPDLKASIKKSNYLSKEFGNLDDYTELPMVKVFSDNEQTILWRKKLKVLKQNEKTDFKSAESVTKLINNLKFTLENSIYEPVT